jgi:hypothetical protein
MRIERDTYLQKLIEKKWNGHVKVVTGLRRSGKSYILFELFREHLLSEGVARDDIIGVELDKITNAGLRHPIKLYEHIESLCKDGRKRYVLIDEIQMVPAIDNPYVKDGGKINFYDTLNSLMGLKCLDIYVTGSNSKMLSTDILTEFRGRGDEIRIHPLSFSEYYSAVGGDKGEAFQRYQRYGGMPLTLSMESDESREKYLRDLFTETYLKDIKERHRIERLDIMEGVIDILCSDIGSLTNPKKIADTVSGGVSDNTVKSYIDMLKDAFLFAEAKRYDVKGRNYLKFPVKYYCEDIGLRNARLEFRQMESTHIMENIVYNELMIRGFNVDAGIVPIGERDESGKTRIRQKEVDFVVNKGDRRVYIQSAFAIPDKEKMDQEKASLHHIKDFFPRVIIRTDTIGRWYDDEGFLHINLIDFLLDKGCI